MEFVCRCVCVCVCVRACTLYVHMLFLTLSEAPADLWALWHCWCYITTWPDHMELLHTAWYYVTIIQLVLCYSAHTERNTPYTHTATILHMYCLLWNMMSFKGYNFLYTCIVLHKIMVSSIVFICCNSVSYVFLITLTCASTGQW